MAGSTYSTTLRLQLIATGQKTGQWGAITNVNLGDLLEQAITDISAVPVTDGADTVLVALDGEIDQARSMGLAFTGALTDNRTVICPAVPKFYLLSNSTTGGYNVTLKTSAVGSTGVSVPPNVTTLVMSDGTNVVSAVSYVPTLAYTTITYGSINGAPIGNTIPSTGAFSSLVATTANINGGTINGATIITPSITATAGTLTNVTVSGTVTTATLTATGGTINGTSIGATTPSTGAFTNLSYSNQLTSLVVTGTAPIVVASTTRVENLNVARSGVADTATITNDTTTNTGFYPLFAVGSTGNQALYASSTKWTFNPSTGAMTIAGPLTASALTPTTALGTAYGGTGTTTGVAVSRTTSVVSGTSITPNCDTTDIVTQTNTAAAGTLTINAPTGTPTNFQKLTIRVTTTNLQTLSFNTIYAGSTDLALPSSMTAGTTNYLGFVYNSTSTKWQLIAKVFGF